MNESSFFNESSESVIHDYSFIKTVTCMNESAINESI